MALERVLERVKWAGRVLWSIATRSEATKSYPDRVAEILWNRLPRPVLTWRTTHVLGRAMHRRACRVQPRGGGGTYTANYTRFFRNVPQLELLRDLALEIAPPRPIRIAVLGCSTGAELYSAIWMLRMARPNQEVHALGVDLSETCIRTAAAGVYALGTREVEGISETTHERLFLRQQNTLRIQDWLKQGITWWIGDVCSSDLPGHFGLHDLVLANNFLFHMQQDRAGDCLRNVTRLVAPNGYLFLGGVDLDLRTRSARELGLVPVAARLAEIYTAEEGMLTAWPFRFWGLEPMDTKRHDWPVRYTTVFRLPAPGVPSGARRT